ncbi:MAG: hypothetical protein QOH57_4648 [Mycobacterium sp.]|jgi:hypothetical protein|nr:hypothetical protein [Mycobacterium sp.]
MKTRLCAALTAVVVVVGPLSTAGPARADNSNSNTNNNDVTNVGDASDGDGSTDENTAWPPTDLDWPPGDLLKSDNGTSSGGGAKSSASVPIVMPAGEVAPETSDPPGAREPTKPIVAVDAP